MTRLSPLGGIAMSALLSVFLLTDQPGLPLAGATGAAGGVTIRSSQGSGAAAGGAAAVPGATPSTFNQSQVRSDNATALRRSLTRSHAFSQNLYRRQYDNATTPVYVLGY